MGTENVSPRFRDIETWENADILAALLEGQIAAVAAAGPALPAMDRAARLAVPRLAAGGRIVYAGAGTSGRIGVQDGVELVPTFGWPRSRVIFMMAGGKQALMRSLENVEDDKNAARAEIAKHGIGRDDVVIGLAASGRTPYTIAAVAEARARGALTIGIANNRGAPLLKAADIGLLMETGEEPIAGSTRMKAGTSQKAALNMLMTLVMIRLGRVYRGMMIEVQATNEKLRLRRERMLVELTECKPAAARKAISESKGSLKLAVLTLGGMTIAEARKALAGAGGDLRKALKR